jgi:hypothetical protein
LRAERAKIWPSTRFQRPALLGAGRALTNPSLQPAVEVDDAPAAHLGHVELVLRKGARGGVGPVIAVAGGGGGGAVHRLEGGLQAADLLREDLAQAVGEALGDDVDIAGGEVAGAAEGVGAGRGGAGREGVDEEACEGQGAGPLLDGRRGAEGLGELGELEEAVLVAVEAVEQHVAAAEVLVRDGFDPFVFPHCAEQVVLAHAEGGVGVIEGTVPLEKILDVRKVPLAQACVDLLLYFIQR